MGTAEINLAISLWGAALATALAVLKVFEHRYAQSYNLLIIPKVPAGFSSIEIDVTNLGRRPITVRSVTVVYGPTDESGIEVSRVSADLPKRLEDAYLFTSTIPRSELIAVASKIPGLQRRYSSLWVVATIGSGRRFVRRVAIDHSIIPGESYAAARNFIAVDLFLGLPQLQPEPSAMSFTDIKYTTHK